MFGDFQKWSFHKNHNMNTVFRTFINAMCVPHLRNRCLRAKPIRVTLPIAERSISWQNNCYLMSWVHSWYSRKFGALCKGMRLHYPYPGIIASYKTRPRRLGVAVAPLATGRMREVGLEILQLRFTGKERIWWNCHRGRPCRDMASQKMEIYGVQ
jgi:hypothetical protein